MVINGIIHQKNIILYLNQVFRVLYMYNLIYKIEIQFNKYKNKLNYKYKI